MEPESIWPVQVFSVTKDTKTKAIIEKNPIPIINCDEVEELLEEFKVKGKVGKTLKQQDCVDFAPGTLIGEDSKSGLKKSIQIEAMPCLVNCYNHTFPAPIGLQEITPTNSFPFPVYRTYMHQFNMNYVFTVHYTSAVTDFLNYDTPA